MTRSRVVARLAVASLALASIVALPAVALAGDARPPMTLAPHLFYNDIGNHWAQPYVELASRLGILMGVTGGPFDPEGLVSRAEFAAALGRTLGLTPTEVADEGIAPWGDTGAGLPVTREEAGAMVGRALRWSGYGPPASRYLAGVMLEGYSDFDSLSEATLMDLAVAVSCRVISGRTHLALDPVDPTTRAEAATMLVRLWDLLAH